jgi:hypothetical protein
MINTRNDPVSIAKAQVDKWFGQLSLGHVFIARDKRVFRLTLGELEHMREDAESQAIRLQLRMRTRTYFAVGIVVATFILASEIASRFATPWNTIIKNFGFAIYTSHGVWIFYEAYRLDRDIKAIRDRLTDKLSSRVPLPGGLTDQMTRSNPFQAILIGCVLTLVAVYALTELLAHHGIDLVSMIPMWIYVGIVPVAWVLYFLAQHFDRKRGVGS